MKRKIIYSDVQDIHSPYDKDAKRLLVGLFAAVFVIALCILISL